MKLRIFNYLDKPINVSVRIIYKEFTLPDHLKERNLNSKEADEIEIVIEEKETT